VLRGTQGSLVTRKDLTHCSINRCGKDRLRGFTTDQSGDSILVDFSVAENRVSSESSRVPP
jgi:hypothetical protein